MVPRELMLLAPGDAALDFAEWLQTLILGRDLTPQELEQIAVKAQYWWAVAVTQCNELAKMASRN